MCVCLCLFVCLLLFFCLFVWLLLLLVCVCIYECACAQACRIISLPTKQNIQQKSAPPKQVAACVPTCAEACEYAILSKQISVFSTVAAPLAGSTVHRRRSAHGVNSSPSLLRSRVLRSWSAPLTGSTVHRRRSAHGVNSFFLRPVMRTILCVCVCVCLFVCYCFFVCLFGCCCC